MATVAVTAVAAWYDLKTGHIPNWVTLGPLAVAPVAWLAFGWSVGGSFRAGALAAQWSIVGAICQWVIGIEAEFYAFIAAALFAPARLAWEGKLLKTLGNTFVLVANPFLPKAKRKEIPSEAMTSLRFGPAIFAGALIATILHWRMK